MLRLETETVWWLVTHPDHARLSGDFAARWGNDQFLRPEPREHVLRAITRHDDGWTARDSSPQITRQGKPSAFSIEFVGKYSGFEEIDLMDFFAVRDSAEYRHEGRFGQDAGVLRDSSLFAAVRSAGRDDREVHQRGTDSGNGEEAFESGGGFSA